MSTLNQITNIISGLEYYSKILYDIDSVSVDDLQKILIRLREIQSRLISHVAQTPKQDVVATYSEFSPTLNEIMERQKNELREKRINRQNQIINDLSEIEKRMQELSKLKS